MSKLIQSRQTRSLEERYELLRKTLAHYLLLQVGTFVGLAGFDAVGPAMNMLTDMKANLKVEEIKAKNQGSRRSEERRVGKEGRTRRWQEQERKKLGESR